MHNRSARRIFSKLDQSPGEIRQALRSFSANASAFTLTKDEALAKYKNKWIAIYKGEVRAVADSLTQLASAIADKQIPAAETLFRHIDPKDKVFIL